MIEVTNKKSSIVMWQPDPEEGVAEKALLIETYIDIFTIRQGDDCISINYESIPELIKALKIVKDSNH